MIKKIAGSIGRYKTQSILAPLFIVFEVVLECAIPFVMAMLLDSIEKERDLERVFLFGGIMLALALVSLVCGVLAGHFAATASTGFAANLRRDMYYKIQEYSFANVDKFSSAGLITRLTVDVANVQNAFMMLIRMAIRAPLMMIFSIVMTVIVSPALALIFAAIVPVLAIAMIVIILKVFPIFHKAFKRYDTFNESVQENVRGARVVKAYVREDFEKKKFEHESDELRKVFQKADSILMLSNPIMQFSVFSAVLLLAVLGSRMIVSSGATALSVGDLSSLLTYTMQILSSLMMLAMVITMIAMSWESCRRIAEVLDEESTIVSPENALKNVKDGDIDFEGVGFKYFEDAEREALSDINLHIPSGSTVGVIGGTGSGKTSLVQLIPRLYDVSEGSVKVGGADVREYDVEALRNAVAVVLQKNTLFSGSVKENMRWGNENATDEQIIHACTLAQADDFVRAMPDGYDTYIEQGGANVSGGQKQRLCIARALLKEPKVLILDDSTSAVDTHTDAKLREAFRNGLKDTTKIIIAQRISSVQDADMIIVMDDGKIAAAGKHDELLRDCRIYREVYESQNRKGGSEDVEKN